MMNRGITGLLSTLVCLIFPIFSFALKCLPLWIVNYVVTLKKEGKINSRLSGMAGGLVGEGTQGRNMTENRVTLSW